MIPIGLGPPVISPRRGEGSATNLKKRNTPRTYTQLLLHIVYSTKHREPWITPDLAERLYLYIGGIVRAEKGVLYDIGGADHVHLYVRWRSGESVPNLLRPVKPPSPLWAHQTFPQLAAFAWQGGYSAFSVSKSREEAVKKYIAGQVKHHKKEGFKTDLLRILRAHEIESDERYVFD